MTTTRQIRLGPVTLGTRPVIAAVVTDLGRDRRDHPDAEVLELRVDRFREIGADHVREVVAESGVSGRGVLVTVRSAAEGGERSLSDTERLDLYRGAVAADAFDLEIESDAALWRKVGALPGPGGRLLIGSFHDFKGMPSRKTLDDLNARGRSQGADLVKIACRVRTDDDLRLLLDFTRDHAEEGVITLGMGEWGPLSRLVAPLFGALLSYGFLEEAVAPGQLSVEALAEAFAQWYPDQGRRQGGI